MQFDRLKARIDRLLVGPALLISSTTVHHKTGATNPPINTIGTGQKKITFLGGSLTPSFIIC